MEGKGILTSVKLKVEGNFADNKANGYAKVTANDGSIYRGVWNNDKLKEGEIENKEFTFIGKIKKMDPYKGTIILRNGFIFKGF